MNSWIKAILPQEEYVEGSGHVVVVAHDVASSLRTHRIGFKRRVAAALRLRTNGRIEEVDGFDVEGRADDHLLDLDIGHQKWD